MRRCFLILLAMILLAPADVPAAPSGAPSQKVEIFVTSWCSYCKKLESFLIQHHIDYKRYDIEQDTTGAEIFEKIGGEGVPVVRIGKEVIHGYDPDAVLAALQEHST